MTNPMVKEALRRQWPLIGAFVLGAVFAISHFLVFLPAAVRYDAALKRAGEMGVALDPSQQRQSLPPRVFALLTDNAMPASTLNEGAASGAITASLLDDLNKRVATHGMEVLVTEPGPVTQQAFSVQVRAHLKARCRYAEFTSFLDDLARSGSLTAVDRFTLQPTENGGNEIVELWVSRNILKQPEATP
jgi:Type II secretion system (T2SS), protein M subtype b